ncbi:hypothetical protein SAMN05216276_105722 [Streptosporangium subroseum]|uniref:Secreted protein n=1 Tax=Streptosporangium subroseum TaxID=106412 RepID=A0A239NI68_9ACTN|nr:hypothetical protein [Streptosporangium subroseum]SNT53819.1 hypothetical protein SAMN05216276_105722 [Streptosporangium subroseum]
MNDTAARTTGRDRPPRTAHAFRRRLGAVLAVLPSAVALLFVMGPGAGADSTAGGDVHVAQTLGDRELTVILRRVTGVPGPLHVDVITHAGTAAGRLTLGVTPTGVSTSASAASASGTTVDTAVVTLGGRPGTFSAVLDVTRAGPWELSLGDEQRTATIPFVVPKRTTSPAETAVYMGFGGAGALVLVTVLVAVRVRRFWWTLVPAGGLVACLTVAVTGALLSSRLPPPPSQGGQVDATIDGVGDPYADAGQQIGDYSRPPATLLLRSSTDRAGEVAELRLTLSDASTGLPVDDVVVHDGALLHLLVVGPSGQLRHLHPVRTGAGVFEVPLSLPEEGHYAVSAEFARRGGGVQQLRSATGVDAVPGSGAAARTTSDDAPPQAGTGTRTVAGVDVRLTASSLVAGRAAVLTARVGETATLQPWLGMLGHLIVVGPVSPTAAAGTATQGAQVWAHSHSMGAVPDGTHDMSGMEGMSHMKGMEEHSSASSSSLDMDSSASSAFSSPDLHSMSGLTSVNGDSTADETVAAYGPDISFVYTFPATGHYRVWIQAERDNTILTVPYLLHVTGASERTS